MYRLRSLRIVCLAALLLATVGGVRAAARTEPQDVGAASVRLSAAATKFHYAAEDMPGASQATPFLKKSLELRRQIDLFRAELDTDADPRKLARKFDRVSRAYDELMRDSRRLRREDRDHLARRTEQLREAYAQVADSLGQ
jgi:hypothetical protein